jgi:hypothetical protein
MNHLWVDWLLLKIAQVRGAIRNLRDAPMLRQLFRPGSIDGHPARSLAADADTDDDAVRSIAAAIDLVLKKTEAERADLARRLDNGLSQAVGIVGHDVDDSPTRIEDRPKMPKESDAEIRRAQERVRVVEQNISHFKFLKAALQTRFPDTRI